MHSLYPLTFQPLYKDKVWGGHKIKDHLHLNIGKLPNCGEAWLMSGVEGNPTIVSNGYLAGNELNELVEVFLGDLVGDKVYNIFGNTFPILLKIIDANDWLSVQVHPNDELAQKRGLGFGKTEMWYILQADPHAQLISGFISPIDKNTYIDHLEKGRLKDILNFENVRQDEVYFMPAGRVHALGPGCLLAEIQQTSDITYRIYDWDRMDEKGNGRQLHIDEAIDAIDFDQKDNAKPPVKIKENGSSSIIKTTHFSTNLLSINQALNKDYYAIDSFVILLCIEGSFDLIWEGGIVNVKQANAILIPNLINQIQIKPDHYSKILEVYIE